MKTMPNSTNYDVCNECGRWATVEAKNDKIIIWECANGHKRIIDVSKISAPKYKNA